MNQTWVVMWRKGKMTVFKTKHDWSLDPLEALEFDTWLSARWAARGTRGAIVTKCWTAAA